jgi:VIT1/CCC1 family predicted Fe2+/Mn2+ transporter
VSADDLSTPAGRADGLSASAGRADDESLAQLLSDLTDDLTTLLRQELQLVRAEMRVEAAKAARASLMLAAAAILALLALFLVAWAASWGLAELMPAGLAFVVVGVLVGIVGAVLGVLGRNRIRAVDPVPRTTAQTLKEDRQWLSNQMH